MLILSNLQPFADGGSRLVFVHPQDKNKCVKVTKPGRNGEEIRKARGFPRSLLSPNYYDDNHREEAGERYIGRLATDSSIFSHIPRFYGWANTDMGRARVSQLMRDYNGNISQPLNKKIDEWAALPPAARQQINESIAELKAFLWKRKIITGKLSPLNVLFVRASEARARLYVIEGFGGREFLPVSQHAPLLRNMKIRRALKDFDNRIAGEFASLRG